MIKKTRKKTVAFFEINDMSGSPIRQPLPWPDILADLSRQSPNARRHDVGGVEHWGQTYTFDETDHLILVRLRDDAVSSFNTATGEFLDSESEVGQPWVELSVIHFLPDSNRFGFLLGSNASPRVSSLAQWINSHKLFDEPVEIGPIISRRTRDKISGTAEARMVTVRLAGDQLASVQQQDSLYGAATVIGRAHGDVEVELVIRVKGKVDRAHQEERAKIMRTAERLLGADFEKAVVELVNYDDRGKADVESVDFLNHRLTKKLPVTVKDEEGHPVRIPSAIMAIYRAADLLEDELRT